MNGTASGIQVYLNQVKKEDGEMEIKVFGPGCPRCKKTEENAVEALKELNLEANVVKVSDLKEIMRQGIIMTPGLAIDEKVVCTGKIPSVEEIKKWLSEK
jgi:small redox-active disulfide protein 2